MDMVEYGFEMSVVTGDQAEQIGNCNIDNMFVSVSGINNISIGDNVSTEVSELSREDIVSVITGDTVGHGGVQDGGGGQDDGQPDADKHGESLGPGRGDGLLVVTGKRRGRPRKGIVPDGLVQLRIQNFVKKFDIGRGGGCSQVVVGEGGLVR